MKCLLLGGTGFVGQAIAKQRPSWNWTIVGSKQADLTDHTQLYKLYDHYDVVINCAGFYGGIPFNHRHGEEILFRNSLMVTNVCALVHKIKPKKFVNIGSGCIYPVTAHGSMTESCVGTTDFHPSIKHSAMTKYFLLKTTEMLSVPWEYLILSNVYGPGEHVDFERSHVIGSLVNKIKHAGQTIKMIGTGQAIRDFVYISDAAEAVCRYCELSTATCSPSNISSGQGVSIKHITETLIDISGKDIAVIWGDAMDNGVLHKVLDNSKMIEDIGHHSTITLTQGLQQTWNWINKNDS